MWSLTRGGRSWRFDCIANIGYKLRALFPAGLTCFYPFFILGRYKPLRSGARAGQEDAPRESLRVKRHQNPEGVSGQRLSELCHAYEQEERYYSDVTEVP